MSAPASAKALKRVVIRPAIFDPYRRPIFERRLTTDDSDPFADAAGARLSAASKKQYLFAWRRYLGFLKIADPAALNLLPCQRLTKERVRAFTEHLAETNIPGWVAIQVDALYKAARIILPDCDLGWLKSMKARLHTAAPLQRPTGPVITSLQILQLGLFLMDENHPGERVPIRLARTILYRDGLIIALLAFAPLRRKNLASLQIDRHLIAKGANRYIVIPASETKTRVEIEFAVPALLLPYLDVYLTIFRPNYKINLMPGPLG